MKKAALIGLLIVVAALIALLLWRQTKISRDRNFSRKLAGTWLWSYANIRESLTYTADSRFSSQEIDSHRQRTNTYQRAGTWFIKDGRIITTYTNDSNTRARVPRTATGQIVRIDAQEFIVSYDTNKLVLNRITP